MGEERLGKDKKNMRFYSENLKADLSTDERKILKSILKQQNVTM
jgi:hypothetical protein